MNFKNAEGRLAYWLEVLTSYDMDIKQKWKFAKVAKRVKSE